jgi:hypothetical protein
MTYIVYMPADRQLLNFIVEKDLLERVDDFRFQNRFATRAGAIKWLLDWAIRQAPSPPAPRRQAPQAKPHEAAAPEARLPEVRTQPPVLQDPQPLPVAPPPRDSPPPPIPSHEPSQESVIQALRSQGYEVGETATQDGQVRIVVRTADASALVTVGKELHELAAGRVTLAQVAARRRGA